MKTRTLILSGASLLMLVPAVQAQAQTAAGAATAAAEDDGAIAEIVVTAQKRLERLQDVPVAVSAFSQEAIEKAGVVGATDLRTQIPNLNFSRNVVNGPNFGIRGIGAKIVGPSADTGVGVHVNNAPLSISRITDADFFDVQRVEVLRGPQGTLYGRNATGGVFNTITAKPEDSFKASITAEYGNYDNKRLQGMINVPLGETLALRVAGFWLNRDGYSYNTFLNQDSDDRDLWSGRATLSFKPTDNFRAFIMVEHFHEKDRRMSGNTTRCTPDAGPATVGGVTPNPVARGLLSQGCLNASIYTPAALGAPNSFGTVNGPVGLATGVLTSNVNAGVVQNSNPRRFASPVSPYYFAKNTLYQLNIDWDVADDLTLSALSSYDEDKFLAAQQPESAIPSGRFNTTALTPGGVYNDPQLGPITFPAATRIVQRDSKQFSQELRLQSDFEGPVNFSVGGIYFHYKTQNIFTFPTTAFNQRSEFLNTTTNAGIYIDRSALPDGTGHNYLLSNTPYRLKSGAAMGEVYWKLADTLKFTGGLRYTHDNKRQLEYVPTLFTPGRGLGVPSVNRVTFKELTGRANLAWTPEVEFTRDTLVYASYSRGYKGGGFNTQAGGLGTVPPSFKPEFVNSYEIGTKNTLAGGRVILNLTGFYYDYKGYQIAKLVGSSTATENVDAKIKGIEFESIVEPVRGLRFNANLGLLDTKVRSGLSLDELNLTQGDPALTLVKNGNGTNCVANTSGVAGILGGINAGAIPTSALLGLCTGAFAARGVVVSAGTPANLRGKQLPDAPKWTLSLGAQYSMAVTSAWEATLRADYYRQGKSYSRVYNEVVDRLKGYGNLNMTLTLDSEAAGVQVQGYVRNLTNKTVIQSSIPTTSTFGLFSVGFLNEPRVYGLRATKRF